MGVIYVILGIIGWAAAAIVVPMYVWAGRSDRQPRGFDVAAKIED